MNELIINNRFYAPYYIFIRCNKSQIDSIFERLELNKWTKLKQINSDKDIALTHKLFYSIWENGWLQIFDDWAYSLWYDSDFKSLLTELCKEFEIYYCSVGDIDSSYEFSYYKHGELSREYILDDSISGKEFIEKSYGQQLPFEDELNLINDEHDKILFIASKLGINVSNNINLINSYYLKDRDLETLF
ncbi:hypothetical protein [Flammeovirga kamogawensis]|uniref:DUF4240 domain-containing protein n=1 Tax=Flammeovirga kamogawensis TaxID=373891 RepID=A0ABX8H1Z3_9BACT|nr:hypothetical protein [Flammeovirga kamogawensis]QWG09925.1 hypothetical protein KM029_19785 [Flammeovirga kamogawensis]TRX65420.1 hypothetical protein EO216_23135 [Flammeovirga kamogawensis]